MKSVNHTKLKCMWTWVVDSLICKCCLWCEGKKLTTDNCKNICVRFMPSLTPADVHYWSRRNPQEILRGGRNNRYYRGQHCLHIIPTLKCKSFLDKKSLWQQVSCPNILQLHIYSKLLKSVEKCKRYCAHRVFDRNYHVYFCLRLALSKMVAPQCCV